MNTNPTPHPYRWRVLLIVIIAIAVSSGLLGAFYRHHLMWKYVEWQGDLYHVAAIPNTPMPDMVVPEDWVEHSLNGMTFRLPPEMALTVKKNNTAAFNDGHRKIVISSSHITPDLAQTLTSRLNSSSAIDSMTLPRLRLECFRASADEFRWSMSSADVRKLADNIALRPLLEMNKPQFTESFSRADWDAIILFDDKHVILDWQSTTSTEAGYAHFTAVNDEPLDFDWIRKICQSIEMVIF
jgi:hypothetical protein